MTKEEADIRRAQLARVIVNKSDDRIRELQTAIEIMGACIWAELQVPIGDDDPNYEKVREAHRLVTANPIAWEAVAKAKAAQ